jgi:hypothetical protein
LFQYSSANLGGKKTQMKLERLLSVALLALLITPSFAVASDDKYSRPSLAGLRGVMVLVEPLAPEVERQGLKKTAIQTDAELRLRRAGIQVLTQDELLKAPGSPHLYLTVTITTGESFWGASVSVDLIQSVRLERDPTISVSAVTWSTGGGGGLFLPSSAEGKVRGSLNDYVDEFINAYLAMNLKK